jgi:hypothetical protein
MISLLIEFKQIQDAGAGYEILGPVRHSTTRQKSFRRRARSSRKFGFESGVFSSIKGSCHHH